MSRLFSALSSACLSFLSVEVMALEVLAEARPRTWDWHWVYPGCFCAWAQASPRQLPGVFILPSAPPGSSARGSGCHWAGVGWSGPLPGTLAVFL